MDTLSGRRRKQLRSLRRKKARQETGCFLVDGVRACEAMLRSEAAVETLLVTPEAEEDARIRAVVQALTKRRCEVLRCSAADIQSVADVTTAQGLLAVAQWRDRPEQDLLGAPPSMVLALDRVSDPGNVGTILRAADWFGVGAVLLGKGCAELLSPKTVRASAGSLFHVAIWRGVDLARQLALLRQGGHAIVASSASGDPCRTGWRERATTLVLGNEAHGLSPEVLSLADRQIAVPGRGRAESLNVAMAAVALLALADRPSPSA